MEPWLSWNSLCAAGLPCIQRVPPPSASERRDVYQFAQLWGLSGRTFHQLHLTVFLADTPLESPSEGHFTLGLKGKIAQQSALIWKFTPVSFPKPPCCLSDWIGSL